MLFVMSIYDIIGRSVSEVANILLHTPINFKINFDRSRSLKVQYEGAVERHLRISIKYPNSAPLRNINLQTLSDHDCDLSRSLNVKCNTAFRFSTSDFIVVSNSTHMSPCHRFNLSFITEPKFQTPHTPTPTICQDRLF